MNWNDGKDDFHNKAERLLEKKAESAGKGWEEKSDGIGGPLGGRE